MKIHLYIRDLGGGQPVIQVNGTNGTLMSFIWDRSRVAHVRTYDVSNPEGLKKFRREQVEVLNQKLAWPVLVDVDLGETSDGVGRAEREEAQRAISGLKAEVEALKSALAEKLQDGAAVVRQSHQLEDVGSTPTPATPPAPGTPQGAVPLTRGQRAAATRAANRAK